MKKIFALWLIFAICSLEEVKQEIGKRLEIVLGKTHDTERILHD
jgi:hypothetical protein